MGIGMKLLQEVAQLAKRCLSMEGEERSFMTEVAEKLRSIRSTWREQLIEHANEESGCLLVNSSCYGLWSTGQHRSLITLDMDNGR